MSWTCGHSRPRQITARPVRPQAPALRARLGTDGAMVDFADFAAALASPPVPPGDSWQPACVHLAADEKDRFLALCRDRGVGVSDTIGRQLAELAAARFPAPRLASERSR